ncbi:MAG: M23 family metallopeptidase [Candidatus Dormibacteraeota bacterium]|nr:M23 family metallopeptidase [Candidatus Dormibacteraeota bacterium]
MARGIPRLAAHGWALGLALFVLALGPLGFRHPIAEAHATSRSVIVSYKTSVADASLGPVNARDVESQLHTRDFITAVRANDVAAPVAPSEAGASREHLVRFVWPTHGTLTQTFFDYHPGIDIANDVGTPEVASEAGQVVFAGWGAYGIYVEIDHGNGFHSIYGHMSAVQVKTGQAVTQGQQIGLMGATGRASGPHLHFEIRYQGVPQNPIDLFS